MIISTDLAFNRYGHRSPTMSDVGWRVNAHVLFLEAAATGGECLIKIMNARIRGVDQSRGSGLGGTIFKCYSQNAVERINRFEKCSSEWFKNHRVLTGGRWH